MVQSYQLVLQAKCKIRLVSFFTKKTMTIRTKVQHNMEKVYINFLKQLELYKRIRL